jgi:hypothetical protein
MASASSNITEAGISPSASAQATEASRADNSTPIVGHAQAATPKPTDREDNDATPINFEDRDKASATRSDTDAQPPQELPKADVGLISSQSSSASLSIDVSTGRAGSTTDDRDSESPAIYEQPSAPATTVVRQSKFFRLYKGPEGFGFSVQASSDDARIHIMGLKPGGVADKAGMLVGDELVQCNNQTLTRLSREQVIAYLQSIPKFEVIFDIL